MTFLAFIKRAPKMQDTNNVSGVCWYKTQNTDMSPTPLKGKENLPVNPNNILVKFTHMINTNEKIYNKRNNNKHTYEKYIHENT